MSSKYSVEFQRLIDQATSDEAFRQELLDSSNIAETLKNHGFNLTDDELQQVEASATNFQGSGTAAKVGWFS
ncbi:MAG: Franean1_4349 family RiPP [Chloroflexi bacterium]|nr:Franean1_4349 family RiPP [Chloroflexota bacterium]